MIYSRMTCKAMMAMNEAHKDQVDAFGMPFVFHPWHVAESMKDEKRCTIALLHDVIEKTEVTPDILRRNNFPLDVIEAVNLLTKKEDEDYAAYIRKIADNEMATDVKIASLMHNLDRTRVVTRNAIPKVIYELYESSLDFLIRNRKLKEGKKMFRMMATDSEP